MSHPISTNAAAHDAVSPKPRTYWVQTSTGGSLDFEHPTEAMINVRDLAYSLARICRFTGHLRPTCPPYSVAQHLVWCTRRVSPAAKPYALLHDAHESYIGDMSSPLKALLCHSFGDNGYALMADRLDSVIYPAFGLEWPIPPSIRDEVKAVDLLALATERRDLMEPTDRIWAEDLPEPDPYPILPMQWDTAAEVFLVEIRRLIRTDTLAIPLAATLTPSRSRVPPEDWPEGIVHD